YGPSAPDGERSLPTPTPSASGDPTRCSRSHNRPAACPCSPGGDRARPCEERLRLMTQHAPLELSNRTIAAARPHPRGSIRMFEHVADGAYERFDRLARYHHACLVWSDGFGRASRRAGDDRLPARLRLEQHDTKPLDVPSDLAIGQRKHVA